MTAPSRGAKPRLRGERQVGLDATVTPARRVAFEVVRRSFEHGAWADRALRSAAARHGLEGRERAQAQRLAYGAVQRRGTSDHLIERLADRPASELDAPALAALRLGLFELLFADATPDHAAVDQAVELAKGNAGARRQAAAGLVNAVLRRAAREREELLGSLVDATPRRCGVGALLSGMDRPDVVGGARARGGSGADGGYERARGDGPASEHDQGRSELDPERAPGGGGRSRATQRAVADDPGVARRAWPPGGARASANR